MIKFYILQDNLITDVNKLVPTDKKKLHHRSQSILQFIVTFNIDH